MDGGSVIATIFCLIFVAFVGWVIYMIGYDNGEIKERKLWVDAEKNGSVREVQAPVTTTKKYEITKKEQTYNG